MHTFLGGNLKRHILLIVSFLLLLNFSINQKPQWKGKIEQENGVKVIRNPNDPLYGEITFELEEDLSIGNEEDENYLFYKIRDIQVDKEGNIYVSDSGNHRVQKFDKNGKYLLTIGKKGQGPGEFKLPTYIQIDENAGNIYVNNESRKIIIFDKEGKYIDKDIIFEEGLNDFYLDSTMNVWGKFFWPGYHSLKKVNPSGEVEKKLTEVPFSFNRITLKKSKIGNMGYGLSLFITHGYEYDVFLSEIDGNTFIYGNSEQYELNIVDNEGNILFVVQKDEPYNNFTGKEKDKAEYDVKKEIASKGYLSPNISLKFPEYMPFYYSLFTDCKGRVYVQKTPGERKKRGIRVCDIFSKDGYYLCSATIPILPYVIENGYLYTRFVDEGTGEEFVKRFIIKNWNHIKEGIN